MFFILNFYLFPRYSLSTISSTTLPYVGHNVAHIVGFGRRVVTVGVGWGEFNFIRWHFALSALLLLVHDGEHSRGNNTSTSPDGYKSGDQQTFRILKNAPLPRRRQLVAHSYTAAVCVLNLLYACSLRFYALARPSLHRRYLPIYYIHMSPGIITIIIENTSAENSETRGDVVVGRSIDRPRRNIVFL